MGSLNAGKWTFMAVAAQLQGNDRVEDSFVINRKTKGLERILQAE
jgi:hypothetical protein